MFQETGFRRLAKTVTNLRTDRLRRVSARDAVASKIFHLHLLLGLLLPAGELVDRENNSESRKSILRVKLKLDVGKRRRIRRVKT